MGTSTPRVHVEYDNLHDAESWQRMHAAGRVPNVLPYGFHHLADMGFELVIRSPSRSWFVNRALGGLGRRVSGGFELVDAARDPARRSCDVAVAWSERSGAPTAIRSAIPGEPPVVMGSIWMTGPDARFGAIGRQIAKRGARQAAAIWANSPAQLAALEDMGADPSHLHLLHNPGIDVDFWHPEPVVAQEPGLVLSVGNDRHRDHDLVVRAMRRVQKVIPSSRLELVTGHQIAVPSDLGTRHEYVDHSRLRSMYARAAVVAVALKPNIHVSGCTTILESLACERPVVVTAYHGYDGYVDDGKTGILVTPGDEEAFAAAIIELLTDTQRASEMGAAGRAATETRYPTAHFMGKLAHVIRTAVR